MTTTITDSHPTPDACSGTGTVAQPTNPVLPIARYRFRLEAIRGGRLPAYSGSAWRGVFGHALRRSVCVTRQPTCADCLLRQTCAYSYIFETPVSASAQKLRRYPAAPHPFVLEPATGDSVLKAGDETMVGMTLVGAANGFLPYLVHAFGTIEQRGVGRDKARFRLVAVEQESTPGSQIWNDIYSADNGVLTPEAARVPTPPEAPESVVVELLTPLRVKRDGHLVGPAQFAFHDLYRNLLRRLSMLSYFHGEQPLELDFRALSQEVRQVAIADVALRWYDWTRFSARQQSTMEMGGLIGTFRLSGAGLARFWSHLWLGQWLHAGKGTSMGLGRYRLEPASLPAAPLAAG